MRTGYRSRSSPDKNAVAQRRFLAWRKFKLQHAHPGEFKLIAQRFDRGRYRAQVFCNERDMTQPATDGFEKQGLRRPGPIMPVDRVRGPSRNFIGPREADKMIQPQQIISGKRQPTGGLPTKAY